MPDPSPSQDPKPIADAGSLFDTDEVRPIQIPPSSAPSASSPASHPEGYDLEGYSIPDLEEPPRPVELPTPVERPKPKPGAKTQPETASRKRKPDSHIADGDTSEFETEISVVDPVWTRMAEWGPDLVRVGAAAGATLFLAWLTFGHGTLCLLVLMLGGAATVLLSYPILITLERPVRITPEQAVTDFYAAASHHFPHYRRMWLLLSSRAREEGRFSSFEDFRDHWKGRIEAWREAAGAGKYAPLMFDVEGFQADKSTGKATSRADYTVLISVRDQEPAGPIESVRMTHGLIKGPDRMWYLNRGRLDHDPK
jgi:hypothetical protein